MIFLVIIIIFLLLLFFLLLINLKAVLTYDDAFGFTLKYGFIKLYSSDKNSDNSNEKSNNFNNKESVHDLYTKRIKGNLSLIKELIDKIFLRFTKHLVFKNISIKYEYGVGDAATTGVFYGVVSAATNIFLSYMDNKFKVKNITNTIIPDFNNKKNEFSCKFEFNIRAIHLIGVATEFIKFLRKLK